MNSSTLCLRALRNLSEEMSLSTSSSKCFKSNWLNFLVELLYLEISRRNQSKMYLWSIDLASSWKGTCLHTCTSYWRGMCILRMRVEPTLISNSQLALTSLTQTFCSTIPLLTPPCKFQVISLIMFVSYDEDEGPLQVLRIKRAKFHKICDEFPSSRMVLERRAQDRRHKFRKYKIKSLVKVMKSLVKMYYTNK